MSQVIGLDVRFPLGMLFSIIGALLCVYGFVAIAKPPEMTLWIGDGPQPDINLWWGIVLLIFGGVMLWLSRRSKLKAAASPAQSSTGAG